MTEPQQQTLQTDDEATLVVTGEEATLVAPRFDDEETLVAQPVVPLAVEAAGTPAPTPASTDAAQMAYARRPFAPRRSWVVATVLVSVLVGGVLGGAGLYLYQRQSHDAAATAAPPQTETPAEAQQQQQQAAPAPTVEASNAPQPDAPATGTEAVAEPVSAEASDDATVAPAAREPETAPAAERRDTPDAGGNASTRKRGKKGEHDEEVERPGRAARRPDADVPVARADDPSPREARRVDSIFYRPRRAARRERRERRNVDRLRRIFEGTP